MPVAHPSRPTPPPDLAVAGVALPSPGWRRTPMTGVAPHTDERLAWRVGTVRALRVQDPGTSPGPEPKPWPSVTLMAPGGRMPWSLN